MQSNTKIRLLLATFMLFSLGWPQLGWSTAYPRTIGQTAAQGLREVTDKLQREFDSTRTSTYGLFVQRNLAAIGGVYALFALLLLFKPQYRDAGWERFGALCFWPMAFVVWFVVGYLTEFREIDEAHGGHWAFQRGLGSLLISIVTGIIWPLLTIALGLSFWIGIPLYLLSLLVLFPSILFVILRLVVRLPVLIYHHLHYFTVPHPGETAYKTGMAKNLPIPELASTVAEAMYQHELKDFDALPKAWKSKNWKKRVDAFHDRLKAEDRFMEELIKNLRMKSQFRE
jgi:hypothetical protein